MEYVKQIDRRDLRALIYSVKNVFFFQSIQLIHNDQATGIR